MAEEDYWQETAQMYEQLIQRPKMTQKLLTKPPFRYIHDIFTSTLEATGYGNGLFDEAELDGKSITEKDAKINFLVKLLQLTELVIGEQIDVKPTKIVAGHEPEKTNFFLQQMFRAATAGIDTTPHVMQILGVAPEGEGDEEDQAQAEAEAQAQAQQQAEQEAIRQQQEQEEARKKKKKEAERKRQQEEEQRIQQEDQERKAREEEERQRAAKEAAKKKQAQPPQKGNDAQNEKQRIEAQKQQQRQMQIEEEQRRIQQQQAEAEEDEQEQEEQNHQKFQMQEGGRHGALVEEARKLMADDDDVAAAAPKGEDESGPKIKMGRIGKKKKPTGAKESAQADAGKDYTKQMAGLKAVQQSNSGGGFNENDLEFMKKAIQVLCQSTNPLGKSIDYVTDDVDSMSKEYEHWRKEAISCTLALDEQRKITEELIHPLQDTLAELEERIKEQMGKVTSIRSQILRNDITISNMLYSVIQTR